MTLRRPTATLRASRAALLLAGLLALLALALPGGASAQETQPESVLVCLADDDGSYVLLSVAPSRVAEYRRNPRNIVPAPVSGCPASVQDAEPTASSGADGGSTDEPAPQEDEGSGTAGGSGSGGEDPAAAEDDPAGGTAGESSGGGSDPDAASEGEDDGGASEASEPSELANTGSPTWLLLGGGVLLIGLGSGMALRRREA